MSYLPLDIKIVYNNKDKGIKWHIFDDRFNRRGYIVEVIVNPKTLSGIHDYITATYCDMKMAIVCFNNEMEKISPLLKIFYEVVYLILCLWPFTLFRRPGVGRAHKSL